MSLDEMYELAIKAGCSCKWGIYLFTEAELKKFVQSLIAAEREACAQVCEEKQQYAMPIPCPDGIDGCSVMHCVPAYREKIGQECAKAIRARGNKT